MSSSFENKDTAHQRDYVASGEPSSGFKKAALRASSVVLLQRSVVDTWCVQYVVTGDNNL